MTSNPPERRPGRQVIPRPDDAGPGGPAPWASLGAEARSVSLADVRRALAGTRTPAMAPTETAGARASAVLVPLYEEGDALHVVLTRRSGRLRAHGGEVSFPGGGPEADDADLAVTALREAHEEIGLEPDAVEVLGELDHVATRAVNAFIVPYVGALAGRPTLRPNPNEVEAVLEVPVAELLLDEIYREEQWGTGADRRALHFFELDGDTVWGATARVLHGLLRLVLVGQV